MKRINRIILNFKLNQSYILIIPILSLILLPLIIYAASPLVELQKSTFSDSEPAVLAISVTRIGEFLTNPDKEALEFFRRLGRFIKTHDDLFENGLLQTAVFYNPNLPPNKILQELKFSRDWTTNQKTAVNDLFHKHEQIFDTLSKRIASVSQGLVLRGVFDPKPLMQAMSHLIEKANIHTDENRAQLAKLHARINPSLQAVDLITLVGALDQNGLQIQIEIKGSPIYEQVIKKAGGLPQPLSLGKYLASDALITISQVHLEQDPADFVEYLRQFPQTKTVESFLASAGLDLEKDILSNPGIESHFMINLTPSGEGGLPDIRGYSKIKDPAKLISIIPKLKQLAMSLGIFVNPITDDPPATRLSYFLAPNFGIHVTIRSELLLFATSRDGIVEMIRTMDAIDKGRQAPFPITSELHDYWRISFGSFNEQLQRFLQGPLLSGKGIPPIPNIDMASNFGPLEVKTKMISDRVEISVNMLVLNK